MLGLVSSYRASVGFADSATVRSVYLRARSTMSEGLVQVLNKITVFEPVY